MCEEINKIKCLLIHKQELITSRTVYYAKMNINRNVFIFPHNIGDEADRKCIEMLKLDFYYSLHVVSEIMFDDANVSTCFPITQPNANPFQSSFRLHYEKERLKMFLHEIKNSNKLII
jgi:hypothetical protein